MRTTRLLLACAVAVLTLTVTAGAKPKVDPNLPVYEKAEGIDGTIKAVGSDTMNNLMTYWGEAFKRMYPNIEFEVEGKGSGTAPAALKEGTSNFGPMSRKMQPSEIDAFVKEYGYKPTALTVAVDMVTVYINKDNPIQGLTMAQVDAIFSQNRKLGHEPIRTWGDVGLTGVWSNKPVSVFGRNASSGTYKFFKDHALGGGDYKPSVKQLPGSASVIQGVARNRFGIGYSGYGYMTADVRGCPLAIEAGEPFVEPSDQTVDRYPLSRFLYLYVNIEPGRGLDPLRREFIRYIFSQQGQAEIIADGYLPVNAKAAKQALDAAGIPNDIVVPEKDQQEEAQEDADRDDQDDSDEPGEEDAPSGDRNDTAADRSAQD